jgi:hypothetical protein
VEGERDDGTDILDQGHSKLALVADVVTAAASHGFRHDGRSTG